MRIEKPRDIGALRRLWQEAFGDEDAFLDTFFATAFSPERCRCAVEGDSLLGALYWFDCICGGKTLAYYLDGIAVYCDGEIESYLDEQGKAAAFYMVETPSPNRHPGWPLDSLSVNKNTMTCFVDHGNNIYDCVEEQIMVGEYRQRVVDFLKWALGI